MHVCVCVCGNFAIHARQRIEMEEKEEIKNLVRERGREEGGGRTGNCSRVLCFFWSDQ